MRELDHLIGIKRAIPDARGNWTPVSAYEGWIPTEEAFPGHLRAIVWAGLIAGFVVIGLGL